MKIALIILTLILGFCPAFLAGQNLLPNANFEDTVPTNPSFAYMPVGWISPTVEGFNYMTPYNNATPQHLLYSSPSNFPGFQIARSGQAYIGMLIYHVMYPTPPLRNGRREYMQANLKKALQFDSTYCFEIYISLADSVRYASRGQLGVYFSNNAVSANHSEHLPYTPQIIVSPNQYVIDKQNWVQYSASYKAHGGEQFITIGNFNDTTLMDTLFVGGGDPNNVDYLNTYYYIDDVYLGHCDSVPGLVTSLADLHIKEEIQLYPNPSKGVLQIDLPASNKAAFIFQLYDIKGRMVYSKEVYQSKQFDLSDLPSGLYHYRLMSNGVPQKNGKVIIQK